MNIDIVQEIIKEVVVEEEEEVKRKEEADVL